MTRKKKEESWLLLALTSLLFFLSSNAQEVEVFDIHVTTSPFVQQQWLEKTIMVNKSTSITVCLHLQYYFLYSPFGYAFSLTDGNLECGVEVTEDSISIFNDDVAYKTNKTLAIAKWSHLCVVFGSSSAIYVDGKKAAGILTGGNMADIPPGEYKLFVGVPAEGASPEESASIGAFYAIPAIFYRSLTPIEVYYVASCEAKVSGDMSTGDWKLGWCPRDLATLLCPRNDTTLSLGSLNSSNGTRDKTMYDVLIRTERMFYESQAALCRITSKERFVLIKGVYSFESARDSCRLFGGTLPDKTDETRRAIMEIIRSFSKSIYVFTWLRSSYPDECWALHCTSLGSSIENTTCMNNLGQYLLCKLPLNPTLELRSSGAEHKKFYVHSYKSFPWFSSIDGHIIQASNGLNIGMVYNNKYSDVIAEFSGANQQLPLGRLLWNFTNYMTLTSCEETDFTCSDGTCIPLKERCDGISQCEDTSDEVCNELKPLESLSNVNRPPSPWTPIQIEINLKKIRDVDVSVDSVFVWLNLNTKWYDERLEVMQLSDDYMDNKATNHDIWSPKYEMSNAHFQDNQNYLTKKYIMEELLIKKEGNGSIGTINGFEGFVYDMASESSFLREENFQLAYDCEFDLHNFPFDVHLCYINISIINRGSFKSYFESISVNSEASDVGPFGASALKLSQDDSERRTNILLKLLLTRRYGAYVLTTILPVILIGVIGACSHKFDNTDFSNRIAIALSCLIVVASLVVAVSAGNSDTTEVRAIDVFFFYYTFRLFMMFACHVIQGVIMWGIRAKEQTSSDRKASEDDGKKTDNWKERLVSAPVHDQDEISPALDSTHGKEKSKMDILMQTWISKSDVDLQKQAKDDKWQHIWEVTFDNISIIVGTILDIIFLIVFTAVIFNSRAQIAQQFNSE